MTQEQHKKIHTLRADGLGFTEIAARLGLSINTVKSFCRRHGIDPAATQAQAAATPTDACAQCGKQLNAIRRKTMRFCCNTCRDTWWNKHRDLLRHKATVETKCAACVAIFFSYPGYNRRFCSHPCYIASRFGGSHVDESTV